MLKTNIQCLGLVLLVMTTLNSCVSKKKFNLLESTLETERQDKLQHAANIHKLTNALSACEQAKRKLEIEAKGSGQATDLQQQQILDLKDQIADIRKQRDQQLTQVGDLTVLSQSASENIKETLSQLQTKDQYIHLLQAAKTKADSINLALAVNLKGVLSEGIEDQDVEVKVDKTVVFVNLSDKMLYQSGSYKLTSRAHEVLGKIAKIIESRPELEVMVEGYTDNVPIENSCVADNWDLSVKRATSVVRVLQKNYGVQPDRLIAAGRGEYNVLANNDTQEGRSINRRTRIIILPKLDQFYDLLNPEMAAVQ